MDKGLHTMLSNSTDDVYYTVQGYTSSLLFEIFLFGWSRQLGSNRIIVNLLSFITGLYAALFGTCLHFLLRNSQSLQKVILSAITIMFSLAAADVVWTIALLYACILAERPKGSDEDEENPEIPVRILQYKFLLYVTSNIVSDLLLIYRCYTLWNNRIRIILPPSLILLGTTLCGYLFIGFSHVEHLKYSHNLLHAYLFLTLALNVIVTSLMAGRMWWIARQTRSMLGPSLMKKYKVSIAIFIESGLIYAIYVILDVVLDVLLLDAGLVQIVGLVPTLMIVQVGMSQTPSNQTNFTTHKDDLESQGNTDSDSRLASECNYDLGMQNNHAQGGAIVTSPISIPAPMYRVDSVERYRVGYPVSPSSDDMRIGDVAT
ncbi:hypothetical protein AGABI1DRAFT_130291 [Agaricus bisporus var. burnettii JB137-S8]|uniref:Uncharacterized protein n=1 Tax=Agaricus bisporus var. burnettii (strain JB137-S8 / ATCC MYA-4627 / FGSC 10392) TaxID=597362 RepID=K5X390_AGABU|nr:uncharacterized protein AGABI1DRAFT_130291 [Agaricus bisporus var. burnettii JB137-S8]EKM77603.1 hypothetical protein AGABI1DRAFT_130291 [Agaricus bisporus var. burnettii JB137-S8]